MLPLGQVFTSSAQAVPFAVHEGSDPDNAAGAHGAGHENPRALPESAPAGRIRPFSDEEWATYLNHNSTVLSRKSNALILGTQSALAGL